jgi:hypothetical protein
MTSKPPPSSGPFAYNTFVPDTHYKDPVLEGEVWRVTKDHGRDDIYARNMCWSADEQLYLHRTQGIVGKADAWDIINVLSGRVTHTGVPFGSIAADGGFDPADPSALLILLTKEIYRLILKPDGTWTASVYFTSPSPLLELGGSINWLDASGRYMLVRYGPEPSVYLYDRRNMALGPYANPIDASNTINEGSYLGLSPDGRYVVGYDSRKVGVSRVGQGVSWWIDHGSRMVAPAPNIFWSLCGDHGSFISASDGRNYFITYDCYSKASLWRADITNDAEGLDEVAQQHLPNNRQLLGFETWNDFGHVSTVARGLGRDWAFISTEDSTDHHNGPVDPWHSYRQEIIAINVLTGEIKRLAHHRSRSMDYYSQPRLSASWGGANVAFASNFNQSGIVDIYTIPFVPPPSPEPPPSKQLSVTITLDGRTFKGTVVEQP